MARYVFPLAPRSLRTAASMRPRQACGSFVFSRVDHATKLYPRRRFSVSLARHSKDTAVSHDAQGLPCRSYSQPTASVSQSVTAAEKHDFAHADEKGRQMQVKGPWMREGSAAPPVQRNAHTQNLARGKLLTTPSRMLKLILPLKTGIEEKAKPDLEPLALLVHPQQPLSYLERLIQSELPMLEDRGRMRAPDVTFRAKGDVHENATGSAVKGNDESEPLDGHPQLAEADKEQSSEPRSAEDQNVSHRITPPEKDRNNLDFVRWSPSTEIGDFIRDASRGKQFAIEVEQAAPIYVNVPTFSERTYYLRMRLSKTASRIAELADIKRECDHAARLGAQRVAQLGFGALVLWWGAVYWLTFRTELGWDVMEPVTYLVGLTGLIGGYWYFLYYNREMSYRAAMNVTISRRQSQLYEQRGFDLPYWEGLVEEGNRLRREIKMVADEYDVEWREEDDEGDEKVKEALRKARRRKDGKGEKKDEKDDADDD